MALAFLFEVGSIQRFLFSTGKLRDASGASELISSLAFETPATPIGGLIFSALSCTGLKERVHVFRCAGGVIDFTCEDDQEDRLHKFRAIWRLMVATAAPGLKFEDAIGRGSDPAQARSSARASSFCSPPAAFAQTPPAAPIVRPAGLTDTAPEIWQDANDGQGRCKITEDYADATTLAKRQFLTQGGLQLADLFTSGNAKEYDWPVTFEADSQRPTDSVFPFLPGPKRLGLVHIDGNKVGEFFGGLSGVVADVRAVSAALAKATQDAAAEAMTPVLKAGRAPASEDKPVVPARPILLGGDDLTIILRADLAFEFARDFADAFAQKTKDAFREIPGLEEHNGLTAKAGIVFMGPKQPFVQAYELCEALADAARSHDARVSFWRLTGSMIPRDVQELTEATQRNGLSFWRESWDWDAFARIQDLAQVIKKDEVGRGPMRRIPELVLSGGEMDSLAPLDLYQRAVQVLGNRAPLEAESFHSAMLGLGVADSKIGFDADGYVPLLDAHVLAQLYEGRIQ